jgi:plasmid maintenance system killer protein
VAGDEEGGEPSLPGAAQAGSLVISYATRQLGRLLASETELVRRYGDRLGRRIVARVSLLRSLPTLGAGHAFPELGLHQLGQNRDEQFAIKLDGANRLILTVANDPIPRKADGGIDLSAVTRVEIQEIVDYH